jgi:hypothetical protein
MYRSNILDIIYTGAGFQRTIHAGAARPRPLLGLCLSLVRPCVVFLFPPPSYSLSLVRTRVVFLFPPHHIA